jgi:hypothetical protein
MGALTVDLIRARVTSLLARAPFSFTPSPEPFSLDRLPASVMDASFCLEAESGHVVAGMGYVETRVDLLRLTLARLHNGEPDSCYQALLADCSSVTASVVRDGVVGGGDYDVPDEGRAYTVSHEPGRAFSVLRLTLPVDYEAQL